MATLVDGLGNEELGDAGDPGSKVAQLFITGSVVAPEIIGTTRISGLNVLAQGSVIGGVLNDADGAVKTVLISQAANIAGMTVVAGSTLTNDNGEGVVDFQAADFANANYMFVCTARQYTIPGASGLNAVASGTRRASGLEILGPSGTVFDWIAVGQR